MVTTSDAPRIRGAVRSRGFQTLPGDHRFFSIVAIASAVTIVAGFANTYGPRVVAGEPVPPIIHLHAVVFSSWLALFVVQTTLVLRGRTAVHRRLGVAGMVLAVLMLIVGVATSISSARLGHRGIPGVEFPDPEGFLLLNLNTVFVFAALVGAAWYFRRDTPAHKRLMLMAMTGPLAGPGVSRLPFVSGNTPLIGGVVMAFLLAGPLYDLATRRRVHQAYLWSVLLSLVAIPPIVAQLSATAAWHSVASLLLR